MPRALRRCGGQGKPLDDCLPAVKLQVGAAAGSNLRRIASACCQRRFAALNSCGPGVKRLVAAQDALTAERDTLNQLLEHAQADASAATARAESRAANQQKG
jgi:outer membrane murein-binding lipoprotein Lpp